MSDLTDIPLNDREQDSGAPDDLTGRDRITRNVLASWAGYAVFVVAGFVMPRLIDDHLGQETLGVWDFAWSVVAYFGLVQAGVVSSINRYVAKYRVAGDVGGVNRAVSSVSCVLLVMGAIVLVLTLAAAYAVPRLLSSQLAGHVDDAKWVVFLLGVSLAVQIALSGFAGVITGCHRWDLHNIIEAGSYATTVAGMIVVLVLGGGLPGLALMNLLGQAGGRLIRCVVAYRVFRGLSVRVAHARWSEARRMLAFGGKSFVHGVGELFLVQATNIIILAYLGPAALAIYARPRSLLRHVSTLVRKYAYVLGPTASSYHALGQQEQLRDLLVQGTRYAAYIALPLILTLAILGDPILRVWMGPDYAYGLLLGILAVGHLIAIIQESVLAILGGMNAHGRPGVAKLAAAFCAVGLTILFLGPLRWGLLGAAVAVTVPLTIVNGVYLPIYACRQLDVPVGQYLLQAFRSPLLCAIPFGLSLLAARIIFWRSPATTLACGAVIGGAVLALLYWYRVLPPGFKDRLVRKVGVLWTASNAKAS